MWHKLTDIYSAHPMTQFDSNMKLLPPEEGKISQAHTSGVFLEKPGLLKEGMMRCMNMLAEVDVSHVSLVAQH